MRRAIRMGVLALTGLVAAAAAGEDVPRAFRPLHQELSQRLDAALARLQRRPVRRKAPVTFAAELLPANGNRGEALLAPQAFAGNVLYLDRLQSLGLTGVTIQMPYPLLDPSFPRSAEYWDFYRRLADEVRRRHLALLVKNGPVFTEGEISPVRPDYARLSWDGYFAARRALALRVEREIAPDYLSIGNEPSTEMKVLGKTGLTEAVYTRFVRDTLKQMGRGKTRVGAGAGSWDRPSYVRSLARETTLDYIDLHVYPLAGPSADYLERAGEMAEMAHRSGKGVVVGEAWLYKTRAGELAGAPIHIEAFGRDTFSFWAPLDSKMLRVLARFAAVHDVDYVSAFWSKYLFAYLDYETHRRSSPGELLRASDREAVASILAGRASPTGEAYSSIAHSSRP